jgi:hypothetical protein
MSSSETPGTTAIAIDAFSSGQVGSKLWLCEELEKCPIPKQSTIWVYGGWQGVLGLMLLTRPRFKEATVRSFDLDPRCADIANTLCENWVWRQWQFRAFTANCNELNLEVPGEFGSLPSIIINTSVEHFADRVWFEKIPMGTIVILQASDFEHDGAVSPFISEQQMREAFPLKEFFFSGKMKFDYKTWCFHRLMLIGVR